MSSFLIFFTIFTCIILVGQLTLKPKYVKQNELIPNLTVVIPFRNEDQNLRLLIQTLSQQTIRPKEIIFVNDHSTDRSVSLIESLAEFQYTLLHLGDESGKKAALKLGIKHASTRYILTLDSDIQLPTNYFHALTQIQLADAHILPVAISNNPFWDFFNLDYYYLYALNNGTHFLNKPFVASGANFLFKKALYLQFQADSNTQHISSGDDQYFLNYLTANQHTIQQNTDSSLTIQTKIPTTFNAILQQRVRWIKKSSSLRLIPAILGLIGIIYHIGFYFIIALNPQHNIELLLTKIIFDCILFYPYLIKIGVRISFIRIAIFSLLYPFWIIFITISSSFLKPKWKDRNISI